MELPIDHFQLLGVRPATDAQTVLHTLQQRLDRPPEQGFTAAALEARALLLRESADLLSDPERRQAYEAELMALDTEDGTLTPGLDVPPSREIGALLLLMEAGQAIEAFDAARRCLQPPQAPALGSHREADLTLLAGEACRLGARELQGRRQFERAAQLLQEGITLMRRTGRQPEQQRQMEHDLADLLPFRVLDLLRRDLSATDERAEGLKLLEMLVERRGGLEGDGDPALPRKDFQDFFKQIRQYLTVQEQVDLFSRWASGNATTAGSATAEFLASLALTASGFAQRKPERIAAAQLRLEASGQPGLQPFLACQHLLLGRVATAEACFIQGADPALRAWAAEQGSEPLAQLCAYCCDWLRRDVLAGYRDIEADPDLEAYFADRDVQAYVEQLDRRQARALQSQSGIEAPAPLSTAPALATTPPLSTAPGLAASPPLTPADAAEDPMRWPDALEPAAGAATPPLDPTDPFGTTATAPAQPSASDRARRGPRGTAGWKALPTWGRLAAAAVLVGAFVATGLAGMMALRPLSPVTPGERPAPGEGAAGTPTAPAGTPAKSPTAVNPPPTPTPARPAATVPLTSAEPNAAQLRALLEAWLQTKAATLAGNTPATPPADLAGERQVRELTAQQRDNRARGVSREQVTAEIQDFRINTRTPKRIVAAVEIRYSDTALDAQGKVIGRTPTTNLRNLYVFGREGEVWKVAGFRPRP
ncbi:DUF4101 domain-containing protein [Synechococcus sp. ATX 2A4]|nr:DUF4101 domain-containing protein [Synechococcus sp. ATX 2A4]